jgi:PAS domain S-box-containing protein
MPLKRRNYSPLYGYLLAVIATAVIAFARFGWADVLDNRSRHMPFILSVMLAAWYGGLMPGLFATLLAGLVCIQMYWLTQYRFVLEDVKEATSLGIFLLAGATISWLCETLHRTRRGLEAERARLRESDTFHVAIAELTTDFAFTARLNAAGVFVVEALSEGFFRLFGYTFKEMERSDQWAKLVHPDDMPHILKTIEWLVAGETVEGDIRCVKKTGDVVWLRYRIRPAFSPHVEVVRYFGAAQDVTRQKHAEELRVASEDREKIRALELEAVLSAVPIVIWIAHDPVCQRITGNLAAEELLQAEPGGNLSLSAPDAERPANFKVFQGGKELSPDELPMQRAARGQESRNVEIEIVLADGTKRVMLGNTISLRALDGSVRGAVGAFVDITERKKTEASLREADKRKDEFLATLAHELRNPLAPLRNAAEILRLHADRAELRTSLDMIDRQVRQMVRLIDDLLDISRISQNRLRLHKERIRLADVIDTAVEASQPLLNKAGHDFTLSLPSEPVHIYGDHTRLAQVFANLLNNAAKYTEQGGKVWLTAEVHDDTVAISVRDTGIGISPEYLSKIFDMFSQVSSAQERSQEGLGIGLALVKGLLSHHDGTIEARSKGPGLGSEFIVRLPVLGATEDDQSTLTEARILVKQESV